MILVIIYREILLLWSLIVSRRLLILCEGLAGIIFTKAFLLLDLYLSLCFLLLLFQEFLLSLPLLAVSVVLGKIAILTHAYGVVKLVGMFTCPCLLRLANLVLADHTPPYSVSP